MGIVVAIDGPAGSGKGTVAKRIAKELKMINIDTGAMYRCVALQSIRAGIKVEDEEKIVKLLEKIEIEIKPEADKDYIFLNGEDVTKQIRESDVTNIVSPISVILPVRTKLIELQRKMAEGKNIVMEGRDIGTVVFPNAEVKIYLDADVEERAKRRYKENQEKGIECTYEEILENVRTRDYRDSNRQYGALKKAEDAILIDSSNLTIDEVVEKVKKIIMSHLGRFLMGHFDICYIIKEVLLEYI